VLSVSLSPAPGDSARRPVVISSARTDAAPVAYRATLCPRRRWRTQRGLCAPRATRRGRAGAVADARAHAAPAPSLLGAGAACGAGTFANVPERFRREWLFAGGLPVWASPWIGPTGSAGSRFATASATCPHRSHRNVMSASGRSNPARSRHTVCQRVEHRQPARRTVQRMQGPQQLGQIGQPRPYGAVVDRPPPRHRMPVDHQRLVVEPFVDPYRRHLRLRQPPRDAHLPPRHRQPTAVTRDPHHHRARVAGQPVAGVLPEPQQGRRRCRRTPGRPSPVYSTRCTVSSDAPVVPTHAPHMVRPDVTYRGRRSAALVLKRSPSTGPASAGPSHVGSLPISHQRSTFVAVPFNSRWRRAAW
jgi:hypothetical protein